MESYSENSGPQRYFRGRCWCNAGGLDELFGMAASRSDRREVADTAGGGAGDNGTDNAVRGGPVGVSEHHHVDPADDAVPFDVPAYFAALDEGASDDEAYDAALHYGANDYRRNKGVYDPGTVTGTDTKYDQYRNDSGDIF